MLFRKDMDPRCAYCQRGSELDEDRVLCPKKGVVGRSNTTPCGGSRQRWRSWIFPSSVRKISPYKMRKKDCMVTHAIFFHQCAVSARTGSSSRKSREMHHSPAAPTSV